MAETATASTIIGPTIKVDGNLHGEEDLVVLGRVEGSISLTKTLIIDEPGVVKAEISVAHMIVNGVVVGNTTASDSVQITETGRVVGDIKAPRVIIVDGARFRGAVDMGELEAPRPSAALPERAVTRSTSTRTANVPAALPAHRATHATETLRPATTPRPSAPASALPSEAPVAAQGKIHKKVVVKKKH